MYVHEYVICMLETSEAHGRDPRDSSSNSVWLSGQKIRNLEHPRLYLPISPFGYKTPEDIKHIRFIKVLRGAPPRNVPLRVKPMRFTAPYEGTAHAVDASLERSRERLGVAQAMVK